jgi:hypothetical protein
MEVTSHWPCSCGRIVGLPNQKLDGSRRAQSTFRTATRACPRAASLSATARAEASSGTVTVYDWARGGWCCMWETFSVRDCFHWQRPTLVAQDVLPPD